MASKVKVYAPNRAYTGTVGNDPDDLASFQAGVAEVSEDSRLLRYFREAGYGIGERQAVENPVLPYDKMEPTGPDGEVVDARDYTRPVQFGSELRDAAVDPQPGDFLPPINAGEANPHGPKVVAPGIHGVGPSPLRPGEVFVDHAGKQAAAETELARRVLVEGEPATIVGSDEPPGGPLGLSDPGSVSMGTRDAATPPASAAAEIPGKRAKKAEWVAYAVSQGADRDEAEDMSIAKLQDRYGA
jgi:hypothetical protein